MSIKVVGNQFDEPNKTGIHIPLEIEEIHIDNIRTFCDVCGKLEATTYHFKGDKGFDLLLKRVPFVRLDKRITIIGVCDKCQNECV